MKHDHSLWPAGVLRKTSGIFEKAEASKPGWIRFVDKTLYWALLFIAILGNFIVSVVLVPFLLILEGWSLYVSLFFIGLSFGWIFGFILHSLASLEREQHIIASLFIPSLALINVGIFAVLSNKLIVLLKLSTPPHNAFLVGGVYVFGYVLPGAIAHLLKKI